jgi:hypothetical protein
MSVLITIGLYIAAYFLFCIAVTLDEIKNKMKS